MVEADDHAAEQVLDAGLVFADDDVFAEHRDSTMKLLVAVVLGAVGIDGLFKQPQFGRCIQTQHFRVTLRGFGNDADVGRDLRVLQIDRLDVLLVQVRALGGHRRAGRDGQRSAEKEVKPRTTGLCVKLPVRFPLRNGFHYFEDLPDVFRGIAATQTALHCAGSAPVAVEC